MAKLTMSHLIPILLQLLLLLTVANTVQGKNSNSAAAVVEFIKRSCQERTIYASICTSTLLPYAGSLINKPQDTAVAKAAIKASLDNAQALAVSLKQTQKQKKLKWGPISDCVDNLSQASNHLSQSYKVIKRVASKGTVSALSLNDMQTWLSAAMTDGDSCLNGFQDEPPSSGSSDNADVYSSLASRVENLCHIISNALALVDSLSTS